jgi:hypothetical protein
MSSTSSEDSDLAKFAAVAVTGNQIAEGAVKSAQVSLSNEQAIQISTNLCRQR